MKMKACIHITLGTAEARQEFEADIEPVAASLIVSQAIIAAAREMGVDIPPVNVADYLPSSSSANPSK